MTSKLKTLGLRQQMARATNLPELNALALRASGFKDASPHTRQRWVNTIKRRERELGK